MNGLVVREVCLPCFPEPRRGKVRDIFDLGTELLIVATDRISAFDVILPGGIKGKGKILTTMSARWFEWIGERLPHIPTHFITADWEQIVTLYPNLKLHQALLEGRSMLVRKYQNVLPVEIILRKYLYGSSWRSYQVDRRVCGVELPEGMQQAQEFGEVMFAPSTKEEAGKHDQNISIAMMQEILQRYLSEHPIESVAQQQSSALTFYTLPTSSEAAELAARLTTELIAFSCEVFQTAHDLAAERGIRLIDTKFEFALIFEDGRPTLVLVDEVLTPDSSRFCRADQYRVGGTLPSLDKEGIRMYLEGLCERKLWDKKAPGPELPPEVVAEAIAGYTSALTMLFPD